MQDQLDGTSTEWSFFDALLNPPVDIVYSPSEARRRHGRELVAGELGCFASHRALWHEAASLSSTEIMLVLEDDLIIDPVFFRSINEAGKAAMYFGYLRLYAKVPAGLKLDGPFLDRFVARFNGRVYGTQAYFIAAPAARRLLASIQSVVRPIDDEIDRFWSHKLPPLVVFPAPVLEINYGSAIESGRRLPAQLTLGEKLAFVTFRALEKFRRHLAIFLHSLS